MWKGTPMEQSLNQLRARLRADKPTSPLRQGMAFDDQPENLPPRQSAMAGLPRFQNPSRFRKAFTRPSH